MDSDTQPRVLNVNQVVAWNLGWLRREAGLTQREVGELTGATNISISAAEQSFEGKRVKKFDAQELAEIALALGVPLSALFVPPDDGNAYQFRDGTTRHRDMDVLLRIAMPDNEDETPVMDAYRRRFNATAMACFASDPDWARLVARWLGDSGRRRAERVRRLRESRNDLMRAAAELGELADAIDREEES